MIAPKMIGDTALVARFAAIPAALRAAIAGEADRLGRMLRDQIARPAAGEAVSLAITGTEDGAWVAPRRPRSHGSAPAAGAPAEPSDFNAAFVAMRPESRVCLEIAFRRVLVR